MKVYSGALAVSSTPDSGCLHVVKVLGEPLLQLLVFEALDSTAPTGKLFFQNLAFLVHCFHLLELLLSLYSNFI
jgi:hypothetical protein